MCPTDSNAMPSHMYNDLILLSIIIHLTQLHPFHKSSRVTPYVHLTIEQRFNR